jgi:tetratricopeptide (TPR) repeat protein
MRRRFQVVCGAFGFLFGISVYGLNAEGLDFLVLKANPELDVPLGTSSTIYMPGFGIDGELRFSFPELIGIQPFVSGAYRSFPLPDSAQWTTSSFSLTASSVGLGVGYEYFLAPRLGVGAAVSTGVYSALLASDTSSNLFFKGGLQASYRLSPSFAVTAGASYLNYFYRTGSPSLYEGLSINLSVSLNFAGLRETDNITRDQVDFKPIFPVLYSQYDKNELGRVKITNHEDGDIQNVKVSFFNKQYMERPKESPTIPLMPRGKTEEVPLYALFNTDVLKLTESTKVLGEISVEYEYLGTKRTAKFEEPLRIYNRNALNWDDDQKAAAFVSSKDPAVMRYSKFTAGIIRDSGLPGVNQNLRFALGLFEGLKLMELNYVIDPSTPPYAELRADVSAIDYLQFPFQTLAYRGGDCSDLSIMFTSMLECIGINSAFITIPGHIYIAFSLDMTAEEAKDSFTSVDDLIIKNDNAWMPVEITLLRENFAKAWSVGAQEWRENGNKARFYPLRDAWKIYDPVGAPDQDTKIALPTNEAITDAFKSGMAKLIAKELPPKLADLRSELVKNNYNPRILNKIGVLYARYGQYQEARDQFQTAVQAGFVPANTNLANISFLLKDFAAAKASYEKSLKSNPEDPSAMIGLARTYFELQNYAEAARLYDRVQELSPTLAAQYTYLASKKSTAGTAGGS